MHAPLYELSCTLLKDNVVLRYDSSWWFPYDKFRILMLVKILECPKIIDGLVILVIVVSSKNFLQPLLDFMYKDLRLYLVFS